MNDQHDLRLIAKIRADFAHRYGTALNATDAQIDHAMRAHSFPNLNAQDAHFYQMHENNILAQGIRAGKVDVSVDAMPLDPSPNLSEEQLHSLLPETVYAEIPGPNASTILVRLTRTGEMTYDVTEATDDPSVNANAEDEIADLDRILALPYELRIFGIAFSEVLRSNLTITPADAEVTLLLAQKMGCGGEELSLLAHFLRGLNALHGEELDA